MSERDGDAVGGMVPEIVEGAERAFHDPADADLGLLAAVHKGLAAVSPGHTLGMPAQRPPGSGEEGLASRR